MGQGKAHFCKSLHEQYNLTKESSYWEIEKASLKELLELLEEELQTIDEKLNSVEKENSAGEEERIKLADENEDLKASVSQRLQATVGTLAKIHKFNSSIAMDEKLLRVEDGEIKVRVLCFGLGIAYFSDETGSKAGYLLPSNSGWEEFDQPSAGSCKLEAISLYDRTAVVAAFEFETGASVTKLKGISTNATVTLDAWMVVEVTITGGTKKVVFQVQSSGTYGAGLGYLADPILYITDATGAVVAIVDNRKDGSNAGYEANLYSTSYLSELQSSVYTMAGDKECAIILNLPEGSFTVLVGTNGETSWKAVVAEFDFE